MKEKILKNRKYILFFFLFLISYLFLPRVAADESWSYGFSYNIATGLIPYKDFNMIVPPLFSLLFSIGLFFYKGILMFHIEQALMMTMICFLLEKLIKEKYLIFVLFLMITPCMIYNLPTYNLLALLITLLLVFLEKRNVNDFWMGTLLGFLLLTKQSIGAFMLLVGIYLVKNDWKRIIKRLSGVIVPVVLCSCYLIVTHSFFEFLDQCIFGMFEFSKNGQVGVVRPFLIFVIFLCFLLLWKVKKYQREWLYAVSFYSICIPLFDLSHFLIGAFSLFVVISSQSRRSASFYERLAIYLCIIGIPLVNTYMALQVGVYPNDFKNHEYRYLNQEAYYNLSILRKYHQNHPKEKIVILSTSAYLFKLTNQLPIDKLDLINVGNWGVDGTKKIIATIEKRRGTNTLFLINPHEVKGNQIDKDVLNYVMKTGEKVDQVLYFQVYQLN